MSHLKFYAYKEHGIRQQKAYHYSQAVRIGDLIECSGQGGWDPDSGEIKSSSLDAEIDQAFSNVELCLKDAGGKGWSQVYRVTSFHVPMTDEALEAMVRNFKKYMPDHQPLWTTVGVPRLGDEKMRVEIQVVAHDPEAKA